MVTTVGDLLTQYRKSALVNQDAVVQAFNYHSMDSCRSRILYPTIEFFIDCMVHFNVSIGAMYHTDIVTSSDILFNLECAVKDTWENWEAQGRVPQLDEEPTRLLLRYMYFSIKGSRSWLYIHEKFEKLGLKSDTDRLYYVLRDPTILLNNGSFTRSPIWIMEVLRPIDTFTLDVVDMFRSTHNIPIPHSKSLKYFGVQLRDRPMLFCIADVIPEELTVDDMPKMAVVYLWHEPGFLLWQQLFEFHWKHYALRYKEGEPRYAPGVSYTKRHGDYLYNIKD